jgi:hypothetical protein
LASRVSRLMRQRIEAYTARAVFAWEASIAAVFIVEPMCAVV